MPESTLSPSQGLWSWPQSAAVASGRVTNLDIHPHQLQVIRCRVKPGICVSGLGGLEMLGISGPTWVNRSVFLAHI
jgi:hypothetical protein